MVSKLTTQNCYHDKFQREKSDFGVIKSLEYESWTWEEINIMSSYSLCYLYLLLIYATVDNHFS